MDTYWDISQAWVAHFDILGFKECLNKDGQSILLNILRTSIDESIERLESEINHHRNVFDFIFYADTFIIYSDLVDSTGYPGLVRASKNFINSCIYKRLPIRGAISHGELILGHEKRIVMGKGFLESYEYGEDQNWIGLILTPSASSNL